jgi:replicative DNA helicase
MSRDLALEKGLPASLDCERLVLGAVLTGAQYQLVAGIVQAEDFFLEPHRRIFLRMGELYTAGHPIGVHSVGVELQRKGQLESCRHGAEGGLSYLAWLTDGLAPLSNLDYYCQEIKNKSILRRLISSSQRLIDRCLAGGDLPTEVLATASEMIGQLAGETAPKPTLRSFGEILNAQGGLNSYATSEDAGIQTPWLSLNRIIGGFRPGQMITLAGLTGSGKSAAALQIAQHAAEEQGLGVALFSLEMSARDIFERAVCGRAGIDAKKLERRVLSEDERHKFSVAASELMSLPLWIDDTTSCTLPAMHAALRRHIQRHKIGLLIIDYLQLMQSVGKKENRTQEVTEISRGMKLAAREFGIPVVVLAQFNRGPATQNREPQLHDLRESGSIEQDSDKVIFLHRKPNGTRDGVVEVSMIIAKQRNGKSRKYIDLHFNEQYTRFEERANSAGGER